MLAVIAVAGGCKPTENLDTKGDASTSSSSAVSSASISTDDAKRPPIRIKITADSKVIEAIERRWKAISEQRLDIQPITVQELFESQDLKADIIIGPSLTIPALVEHNLLVPLPNHLLESQQSDDSRWPAAWKQTVTYGRKLWGVPLGCPIYVNAEHVKPDTASNPQSSNKPKEEGNTHTSDSQNRKTENQSDWIVDRFIAFASTVNPDASDLTFFFKLDRAKSRLNQQWIYKAAQDFAESYKEHPEYANQSPADSWESVENGELPKAIAWPHSSTKGSAVLVSELKPTVEPGRGWVASMTKLNRQTSVSALFIKWLDEDAQRQVFSDLTPSIQPISTRWPSSNEQAGIDRYRAIVKSNATDSQLVRELRFSNAHLYRAPLAKAIQAILLDPSKAKEQIDTCHEEWEAITNKVGREIQKQNITRFFDLEIVQ